MDNNSVINENLEVLKEDLKTSLSISDVFERYFYPVKRKGYNSEAICPFHNDKGYGNFYINEPKGFYKCFNCSEKGDIFTLVMHRYNCGFMDAVWILARDYGFVTQKQFESQNISFNDNYKRKKKEFTSSKKNKNNIKTATLASEDKIALVYDILAKISPLDDEDLKYLGNVRNIDNRRFDVVYFKMPYCTNSFLEKLIKELNLYGLSEKDLIGVPGFFMSENNKALFIGYKGIGIKIVNSFGQTRIQIRLTKPFVDNSNKPQRYIWFSSQDKYMGCSSGAQIDVSYPLISKEDYKAIAFLTEGKFKSEKINQYFNSISLSIQGITTWKDKIKPEILEIQKSHLIKGIFICFDADLSSNMQVFYQCKELVKNELDIFHQDNIFMVIWDYKLGKGIDDLIDNGHKDKIKKVEFWKYEEIHDEYLSLYKKGKKGELLNGEGNVMSEDELYREYMTHVFSKIK